MKLNETITAMLSVVAIIVSVVALYQNNKSLDFAVELEYNNEIQSYIITQLNTLTASEIVSTKLMYCLRKLDDVESKKLYFQLYKKYDSLLEVLSSRLRLTHKMGQEPTKENLFKLKKIHSLEQEVAKAITSLIKSISCNKTDQG
ncbi:hypothetical protein [uncultured Psychrosphaera sp.]|jgi:hypothetical protein|uniref:hypothetical protein n=1 Tax=uncultured Psychrosphaera sp. TaxID=1403522 RepID=UPI002639A119|nr:hypothetical protein [uncultured Psychrosphaera sp.]